MEVTQEQKRQIEEIIETMDCPIDFDCYKSGFESIRNCKPTIIGSDGVLDCSKAGCPKGKQKVCLFKYSFGSGFFCKCPLRMYTAKMLRV